jgi:putative phosphoribosyl transferase
MIFADRADAGRRLGQRLAYLCGEDVVVVGLPRGGVPVAFEVARALHAPLDVILVRKLGLPFQPELAMGAIAEGQVRIVDDEVLRRCRISRADLAAIEAREQVELDHRSRRFRGARPRVPLAGKTVVVVDDGIATGSTASAACQVARAQKAARVVLAAPVAPSARITWLRRHADEVVCLHSPDDCYAIGAFYADFSEPPDDEVTVLLAHAAATTRRNPAQPTGDASAPACRTAEVDIPAIPVRLAGRLTVPARPTGIVVVAHGSGSSRHSPRNQFVAAALSSAGLATLLFDLLTPAEEADRDNVFDIGLLTHRLIDATGWVRGEPATAGLPIGYFGASTGAAAALSAAAIPGAHIGAVVCRGGRPDLAAPTLAAVQAPTLLIVGEHDDLVLDLNTKAQAMLRCENRLAVVPNATHLFAEPGALDKVAALASDWFIRSLTGAERRNAPSANRPRRPAPAAGSAQIRRAYRGRREIGTP